MSRQVKFEVLIELENKDFSKYIVKHYTTLDRLMEGQDLFDYDTVSVIAKRQFTGLKDKNGVEIYEGDIVREMEIDGFSDEYKEWDEYSTTASYSCDISDELFNKIPFTEKYTDTVTMERFPIYWLKNESFGYEGDDLRNPEYCEVIGNIYENQRSAKLNNTIPPPKNLIDEKLKVLADEIEYLA